MTVTLAGADRFAVCAQRVVDYLNKHTPIRDWSVSRVTGGEQVHIHVHHDEIIDVGSRFPWPDTFCSRMEQGAAHVVPDTRADPDYADLDLSQHARTYAGVKINDDDGSLFGVLCGVNKEPLPPGESIDVDLLQLLSDLLSEQLVSSRHLDSEQRQLEMSQALSNLDSLTGLLNRRGWDAIVADAQQRVDAFGDLVGVAVIDLDGLKALNDSDGHQAGDALLRKTGSVLQASQRLGDRMARYGGDEFAILCNNVPTAKLPGYFGRLQRALDDAGIASSIGWALSPPGSTVVASFAEADRQMYEMKRRRRSPTDRPGLIALA